jgi:hypothetical protein
VVLFYGICMAMIRDCRGLGANFLAVSLSMQESAQSELHLVPRKASSPTPCRSDTDFKTRRRKVNKNQKDHQTDHLAPPWRSENV